MTTSDSNNSDEIQSTRLLITRHGETLWNRQGLIQGHQPIALSDKGRAQACALGQRLAEIQLDAAYCSDLRRTVETAALALAGRGLPAQPDENLRECNYGEWEGLPSSLELELEPELELEQEPDSAESAARQRVGPGSKVPHPEAAPGGETLTQVLERFTASIAEIATNHPGETVLVVAHDGPIRAWFSQLMGWPLERCWEIEIDHCGLSEVLATPEKSKLVRMAGKIQSRVV